MGWVFNGWSAAEWRGGNTTPRRRLRRRTRESADSRLVPMVYEGGGIYVDGEGAVLVTETVHLERSRNPTLDNTAVETEFARTIRARHVIWLPYRADPRL